MKKSLFFVFLLALLLACRGFAAESAGKVTASPDERAKEILQHAKEIDKRTSPYPGKIITGEPEASKLRFQVLRDGTVSNVIRKECAMTLARRESTNYHGNMENAIDAVEYALKELKLSSQERVAFLKLICDAAEHAGKVFSSNPAVPPDTMEKAIRRILAEPSLSAGEKVVFYGKLAHNLALRNRDEEALKTIKTFADSLPEGGVKVQAMLQVASVLGYLDRVEECIAFYRSLLEQKEIPASQQTWVQNALMSYLLSIYHFDEALNYALEFKDPVWQARILERYMGRYEDARNVLISSLDDQKTPANVRKVIFSQLVKDSHKDAQQAVDRHMAEMKPQFGKQFGKLFYEAGKLEPMTQRNYPFAIRCFELSRENGYPPEYFLDLYQTTALAGLFRYAEAAKIAERGSSDTHYTPEQRYRLALAAAVMNVPDDSVAVKKAIDEVEKKFEKEIKEVSSKKRSAAICGAARIALIGIRNTAAEELSARDALLFRPRPIKFYDVEFSRTPIHGISDFERMTVKPQVGLHDRPYGGSMDFLVTDVATGNRGKSIGTTKTKADKKFTEGRIAADAEGLHFLFRAYDSRVKDIAAGVANAGVYELYLSAGKDQPYFCLCPDLTTGDISFIWQSSYTNRFYRRPELSDRKGFRTESRTLPDGFQTYFFIAWDYFYNMLPEKDDLWYFENIHWGADGGFTWGGARSIHGRSDSVRLRFRMTPADASAIHRKILAAAHTRFLNERKCGVTEGVLSFWPDPETGDPAFYKKSVLPLEKKLEACAGRYRADLTDKEVDLLYRDAVRGWNNLGGEVSDLRRRYLEEQLIPEK